MIVEHFEQRSPEWYEARRGIPTASNFDKLITSRGQPSKQAEKYIYRLVSEKLSGIREEGFQNGAMLRGIEMENDARMFYEMLNDVETERVGICFHDESRECAASPDSLVGSDGILEIKCPIGSTHVTYLLNNKLPTDYYVQVQGQLYVTQRNWCDFMSYYPGMKPLIIRVKRDDEFIGNLAAVERVGAALCYVRDTA